MNREKQKATLKGERKFLQQVRERGSREPPVREVLREREKGPVREVLREREKGPVRVLRERENGR